MRRVAVGFLLSTLLFGCAEKGADKADAGATGGPELLNEREPNATPDKALRIGSDAEVTASLSLEPPAPDQDWYLLEPQGPGEADVLLSGIPGGDVKLELYDVDRNRLLTVDGAGEGKPERLPNLFVEAKRFVVVSGKKGTKGAYTLTVRFAPPTDGGEREPNERAADATELVLGETIQGRIGHASDEDWFRITLPEPDAGVDAGEADAGEAPDAGVAEAPSEREAELAQERDGGSSAVLDAIAALRDPPPESEAPAAEPSASDPGSPESAQATKAASPAPAGRSPPRILFPDAPPGTALRLELAAVEGVRLEVSVFSEAEAELFSARGAPGEALSARNVGIREVDRTIFVVVKSAWEGTGKEAMRGANPEAPYSLTVSIEDAGATAELEPNDKLTHATPLPPEGFREGFLSPSGDEDYYVLRTDQPVLARFQVSGVEGVDLSLSAVEAPEQGSKEQVRLRVNDGALKEPEHLNNLRCDGECFVKVHSAAHKVDGKWVADYANAEMPYRLSVSFIADTGAEEAEPNDGVSQATPIQLGAPIRGTIHPRKDSDYYLLDLTHRPVRTALRALALGVLKVDVGMYLHRVEEDGKLSLVQTADRAKGEQPETIRYSAEPGRYIVEIRDARNRESNFLDSYQLTVRVDE